MKNDIEKLDQKCIRLDDFVKVIEDKNFMLNDLYIKYDQIENFLKNGNKFSNQCVDLNKKSTMIMDSEDYIKGFANNLKEV